MEKPDAVRETIRDFYSKAAQEPKESLCCPASYPEEDTSHIPREVIERFYGCGSPVSRAMIAPGEVVVDLGSGAGIDCFIAAKKTGREGKVIGVDMTDEMLRVANESRATVSGILGYENVEFRKGFLEDIPVETKSADLITSNCVINLSPDKRKVFSEMWRALKDHGRIVVSDIVSEREIPERLKQDEQLIGECIAGSLTENAFLSYLEQAGFYGIEVLEKTFWKSIENIDFCSVTVRGYKFQKTAGCVYIGQYATYKGPFKVIIDEEGHVFPRNQAVEVCTDTAKKLSQAPYSSMFIITDSGRKPGENPCCSPAGGNGCC
ncbi:MAG: methyltransferase domain-containing protein [Thermodesulfobacteriota bacterium]